MRFFLQACWCTGIPLDTPLAGLVTADPAIEVIERDIVQRLCGQIEGLANQD